MVFFCPALLAQQRDSAQQNQQQSRPEVVWVNPGIPAAPGLTHHVLKSNAMGHDVGYVVWTPPGYEAEGTKRYPVIYFLHGSGGNESKDASGFSGWVKKAIDQQLLPPVICVFPNGGRSGYREGVEKMIIGELIPEVDKTHRTLASSEFRAVAGFSMGGAGSVYLAVMHPEMFCAAASMGGGFRNQDGQMNVPLEKALPVWKKNNYRFFLVNGDQDRPDAFVSFSDILAREKIDHQRVVLPETPHKLGLYYERSVMDLLAYFGKRIKN